MKLLSNIASKVIYVSAFLVLLAVGAFFALPHVPGFGTLDVKIVKSGSMEPMITTGGIVLIREASTYTVGDVVTFESAGADIPTTHRIIGTEVAPDGNTFFITKGDANEERDVELLAPYNIIGKVLVDAPYVGFVLDFARQPLGFGLLIGIPALLILLDELEKIFREMKRMRRKKIHDLKESIAPLVVLPYEPAHISRRMIDVNRPAYIRRAEAAEQAQSERIRDRMRGAHSPFLAGVSSVMTVVVVLAVSSIGGTVSYFSDSELSLGNVLRAGELDFSVAPDGTSFLFENGILTDPDGALVSDIALVLGSAPIAYDISTEIATTSPLCDAIIADVTAPFIYNGPLPALSASALTAVGPWTLALSLAPGAYVSGDTCLLSMVYRGWNALTGSPSSGYEDEERVNLTFTVLGTAPDVPLLLPATLEVPFEEMMDGEPLPYPDIPTESVTVDGETSTSSTEEEAVDESLPPAEVLEDIQESIDPVMEENETLDGEGSEAETGEGEDSAEAEMPQADSSPEGESKSSPSESAEGDGGTLA